MFFYGVNNYKACLQHWLLLTAVLLVALKGGVAPAGAQEIRMELKEHFVLGTSEEDPINMFGDPVVVRSDNSGSIYVFDQLSMRIKVFDSNGHALGVLGERGSGPGEFHSISAGWVTPQGKILVYDQFNTRITTIFPTGEIKTIRTSPNSILWLRDLVPYNGDYLGLYRISSTSRLVHRWDSTFSTLRDRFVDFEDWPLSNMSFMNTLTYFNLGRIIVWRKHLIMAPPVCDGNLLAYDLDLAAPEPSYRLKGTPPNKPPIVSISESEIDRNPAAVELNYSHERDVALVNCWSVGLSVTHDDILAHFSVRQRGSGKIIFVEMFDKDRNLVGGHSIDWLADPINETPFVPVLIYPGSGDRLFITDYRSGVPLVRVLSVELLRDS